MAPTAVPEAPFDVCQVTCVIPVPPDAVPATESVAVLTVVTAAAGDVIETLIGAEPGVAEGAVRVTTADCDAD